MQSFIQRNRIFLLHISFWSVYFSFFFYQVSFSRRGEEINYQRAFYDASSQTIIIAILSYLNYFFWLPRFLASKNLGRYLFVFFIIFSVGVTLHIELKRYIYLDFREAKRFIYSEKFVIQHALSTLFIIFFVGMLKFAEDWFDLESKKKAIENEKLTAEIRFLKAQINPHFLFNTLNNLYYLAMVQSPNTTEVIEKLSAMMRYMLYDSNHPQVPLKKEIDYMKNYISLEKLRLDKSIPIKFDIQGDTESIQIVPLIFITFLENAFKHGVSNHSDNAFVNISIKIDQKLCTYIVENSKLSKNLEAQNEKSGIGLQNVSRRLDLSYPNKYQLNVVQNEDTYQISLQLNLT